MNVIICIDNNGGMLFNYRRQSKDRFVQEDIIQLIGNHRLWMNQFTKNQFLNVSTNIHQINVAEDFLKKAQNGDYCFVENVDIFPYISKIDRIILYKWNRVYPSDTFLLLDLSEWTLENTEDFVGHSHDKITKEIYRR